MRPHCGGVQVQVAGGDVPMIHTQVRLLAVVTDLGKSSAAHRQYRAVQGRVAVGQGEKVNGGAVPCLRYAPVLTGGPGEEKSLLGLEGAKIHEVFRDGALQPG